MRRRMQIYVVALLLLHSHFLAAQKVLYSPFIDDRSVLSFTVAGKAGDYYWVQKDKRKKSPLRNADWRLTEEQIFEIYDARMNLVKTTPSFILSDSTIKEYLVPGNRYFDQLILSAGRKKTTALLQRYTANGELLTEAKIISSFPFNETGNNFLLVRSEDKNKTLLLGFESVPSSAPRIHAILFNQQWDQLSYIIYDHPFITQPFIQDDFISYPGENFNNIPVQLANNGQWLMASPSRTNLNFLLFHFCGDDHSFSYKEIILPASYTMEDVALSIDNEKEEAFAGILSGFRFTTHKNVHVTHYSMETQAFDFDSSYRFNTLPADKKKKENLTKESFVAVPGAGFMLLKEYGIAFTDWYNDVAYDNEWDPDVLFTTGTVQNAGTGFSVSQDGYTRYNTLGGIHGDYARGDLSLFYFPAHTKDSCWSGTINQAQTTALNPPYLSYLVMPSKDKLSFLYNSFLRNEDQYGTSTILDPHGNLHPEGGVVFWKFNNILSFQESRQIETSEVAIPYQKNQRKGFAIIRF
jgi:hypothetical protein